MIMFFSVIIIIAFTIFLLNGCGSGDTASGVVNALKNED